MSDWLSRDHVTLPNSKWRQHLHSLFIPVERRLIGALYELQMHVGYPFSPIPVGFVSCDARDFAGLQDSTLDHEGVQCF